MFLRLKEQEMALLRVAVQHCIATCSHKKEQDPCEECRTLHNLMKKIDKKLVQIQKGRP